MPPPTNPGTIAEFVNAEAAITDPEVSAPVVRLDLIDTPSFSTRWGPNATKMLELLDQLLTEQGEQLEAGDYDLSGARVRSDNWRLRCMQANIKSDAFRQAKKRLLEHGEIDIADHYVTRVKA